MLRAPRDVAQWVPYKAGDPSAPHVTLLYVGKVAPAKVLPVLDAVRRVLAEVVTPVDVDFAGVKEVAGYITPVPGGVGPMTITMLLVNTLEAAERSAL